MVLVSFYISVITVNLNGLNSPTKGHRVHPSSGWMNKKTKGTTICCLQKSTSSFKNTHRIQMKGWKTIFHENGNLQRFGIAILLSDKLFDSRLKTVIRDKEFHYIMIKESTHHVDITIINICTPNIGTPKYIKQILMDLKGEIDNNTITVGDFNTPFQAMDRISRWQINKETLDMNHILDQIDLTFVEHVIQQKQNTHSSHMHTEHFPERPYNRPQNKS